MLFVCRIAVARGILYDWYMGRFGTIFCGTGQHWFTIKTGTRYSIGTVLQMVITTKGTVGIVFTWPTGIKVIITPNQNSLVIPHSYTHRYLPYLHPLILGLIPPHSSFTHTSLVSFNQLRKKK